MDALDRKLLRDFRRLWAQALAIALVLACGVAILMTTFGMSRALEETRTAYYDRYRFADVFAQARRAPLTLVPEIAAIPGVSAVEPRVAGSAILDLPERVETAAGRILSLPPDGLPRLNTPILRSGTLPSPDAAGEVMVNEPFAEANGFRIGDTFQANLNGSLRTLTVTGTFLSPEFIYTLPPGGLMPDNGGFAIIYMPERAAAAAFDMTGAFDSLSLTLTAGADEDEVIDRLDELLEPYGGSGAYGRKGQESHSFIDAELQQLRSMSVILPPIFFGISAFLVNMVVGRIVFLERSEIGLLKAIGYSDWAVALHYLMLAALVALVGVGIGWLAGSWLTWALAWQYARFFDFPYLIFRMTWTAYAVSGLLAVATAALGAVQSALRAARLPPAVAMLPPAPPRFRQSLADRLFHAIRLSQPAMMVLRSLMRWPVRTGLSALGMALAVAILVASSFFTASLDEIVDTAFFQANRQDAILMVPQDVALSALEEARQLPGVLAAEPQQYAPAELRHGHLSKRVPIEARPPGTDLSRIVDGSGRVVEPPPGGILLAETLAAQLELPVSGTVTQYFGLGAYMDMETLNRLFRQAPRLSAVNVTLDDARLPDLHAAIKATPALSGLIQLTETRRSFQETIAQNVGYMTTIYVTIAVLITIGVAYNSARIQLSE
nr:ABC transporter permease [Paracoccaceae bacterium]